MNDLEQMFERQAAWQCSRSNLPWAEKLRLSVVMRKSLAGLRRYKVHGSAFSFRCLS
jgi:hypothetical protein